MPNRIGRTLLTGLLICIPVAYCSLLTTLRTPNSTMRRRRATASLLLTALKPLPLQHRPTNDDNNNSPIPGRRKVLLTTAATTAISVFGAVATAAVSTPPPSNAMTIFYGEGHRQLELCLVTVQRVVYWVESQAGALKTAATVEARRALYLEARLAAKALLTGKIGGGATGKVYTLATLQLPGCLKDLDWHASEQLTKASERQAVYECSRGFKEGLASVVEFDGLETQLDPSPRSSLTIAQYSDSKAVYVVRALQEIVLPAGKRLLRAFGPEPLDSATAFLQQYYGSEIPIRSDSAVVPAEPSSKVTDYWSFGE
jgi:hypothetical protein